MQYQWSTKRIHNNNFTGPQIENSDKKQNSVIHKRRVAVSKSQKYTEILEGKREEREREREVVSYV